MQILHVLALLATALGSKTLSDLKIRKEDASDSAFQESDSTVEELPRRLDDADADDNTTATLTTSFEAGGYGYGTTEGYGNTGGYGYSGSTGGYSGTGEYGTGEYGTGEYGTGQYGTGGYSGTGEYGTGEYGTGEYGTGGYSGSTGGYSGTGEYGTGEYGTGEYGTGEYGTGQYGTGGYSGSTGGYSGGYSGSTGEYGSYGGYGGSKGGYGGSYGGTGHYGGYHGNGGSYGGSSWVECPEMYCWPSVYTDDGEPDWNAMYSSEESYTCASYTEGCPCNEQWEVQCESYGYKTCTPKSEGCYDPFDVECDEATEYTCKDEWSAYCWDKSWGSCPVSCTLEEVYCSSYVYDSQGNVNWTAPMGQFCANATTGCPCDAQWEERCTDSYGDSWCTPKTYPCPIECTVDQQMCYSVAYLSTGEPDWSSPGNQSCAPWNGSCPCHPVYEELCNTSWGTYCQSTHGGATCPVSCKASEHYCYATPYDEFGDIDWNAPWTESCAPAEEGCPCDATWEHKCTGEGYSWCQSKFDPCPVDCGDAVTCWHYSGNTSCATSDGCTCESDELACEDAAGVTECYAKAWYGDSCPLTCNYDTENWCYRVGFDDEGFMTWTEYCHTKSGPDDWYCPVICNDDTAKLCDGDWPECVPLNEECPEVCTSEQQTCWKANFDTSGNYLSGSDTCAPKNEPCPCGDNAETCTFDGYSYCEATYYGCPLICGAEEKYCYPMSFTPEGEYDWEAPVQEVCANTSDTCPCGANAKPCKWTDDWGFEEEWCFPNVETCPVTCASEQKRCYVTDYNASGYPEKYSERCVSQDRSCPCGTNSQECYDPLWEENFCYPLADFWSNEPMKCPLYCSDEEDYCYIPSYDARGNWIRTTEECVPKGQACDCSKGQNAFSCTWSDPFWGSWTECLPTHNGYCPSSCPDGEVPCDLVEDYMPNGTSLGFVQPSVKCATSYDQCPCGKEASRCPNEGCVFKDEGCAVECGADEKKCYLADYTANGAFISDQEVCVPSGDTCPCGKNTAKCANSDLCLPAVELDLVCPCKASETECLVVDYNKDGEPSGYSTQCVKEGTACPCGKNTIGCPDPNDALLKICVPSSGHKKCPAPCTADAILAGNQTCVQINLDASGNFKSETIQCIGPNATCGVGEGMKRCSSGASIAVDTACVNLYSSGSSSGRRLNTQSAQRETCNAIITMSSLRSDAKSKAETVRVKMNSVLQIPSSLKTTLAIKSASTTRRLDGRKLSGAASTMIFYIDNQGIASSATPAQVCEQLKKMVKSSSPSLTTAVSAAGVINAQAGVNMEISSSTMQSRSEAATQQREQKAGIVNREPNTTSTEESTTSSTTSTTSSTTSTTTTTSSSSPAGDDNSTTSTTTSSDPNGTVPALDGDGYTNGAPPMGDVGSGLLASVLLTFGAFFASE